MKKILSIVMALAIVLTMASFPAFAEEATKITPVSYSSTANNATAKYGSGRGFELVFDGDWNTSCKGNWTSNISTAHAKGSGLNYNIYMDLGEGYNVSKLVIGGTANYFFAAFAVYGANDGMTKDATWTEILDVPSAAAAKTEYEINTTEKYQYIRIEGYGGVKNSQFVCNEIEVYGTQEEVVLTPATYTVKYQSSDANFPETADKVVTEGVYVGNTVTETAPAIYGYKPDAETKSLTLVDGTNEIVFTYVPVEPATYTVRYVDEEGNDLADATTGEGYENDEVSLTAPNLIAKGYFVAENIKTVALAAGENEILFTYKKVIKVSAVKFNPLNGTSSWTTGGNGIGNVINGALAPSGNNVTYTINSNATATPVGELIFTFDKTYAFDKMTAFWTNNDTNVDVYVSDDSENWGDAVYTGTTPATVVRGVKASEIDLGGAEGKYIKVVFNKKFYVTLHEFTFEGEVAKLATLGGQIRLPEGSISAGIRFGATVLKNAVDIEGDYVYDPAATTTFGMFIIPQDLLGGATFADYLVANDYAGSALKVPAQRIYDEDDTSITYTAVLTGIPDTAYTRDVVAVPYICKDGTYSFASEIVRNYAQVADSVATAYENGEISLTDDQLTLIAGIIGRTPVAPEVAE